MRKVRRTEQIDEMRSNASIKHYRISKSAVIQHGDLAISDHSCADISYNYTAASAIFLYNSSIN